MLNPKQIKKTGVGFNRRSFEIIVNLRLLQMQLRALYLLAYGGARIIVFTVLHDTLIGSLRLRIGVNVKSVESL
jgi:hypothetical protein